MKLDHKQRHLMNLIRKGRKPDGWAPVSKLVWPFVSELPEQLVERVEVGEGGIAKLTTDGETVLDWT